jgi:hypothetical protein
MSVVFPKQLDKKAVDYIKKKKNGLDSITKQQ